MNWIITSVDNGTTWANITTINNSLSTCYGIAWNGSILVAVGIGGHTILYSDPYSYTNWNATTNSFSTTGYGIAWNGRIWVAVGEGGSTIRYSINAQTWTNASGTLFSTNGYDIAWNGHIWVAVGKGGVFVVYSYDGMTWESGIIINPNSVTILEAKSVTWNGILWIATIFTLSGDVMTSYDGITWQISNNSLFNTSIQKVAFNNRRPYTLSFPTNVSTATIGSISPYTFPISIAQSSQLDVVSDAYYNTGYTNFSMTIRGQYS